MFPFFKSSKEKKELNEAIDAIQRAYEVQVEESKIKEHEINELTNMSKAMKLELSEKELEGAVSRTLIKEFSENEKKLKEKIEESNKQKNKLLNKLENLTQKLENEKLEKEGYEQLVKLLSLHSVKSEKQAGPSSKPDMSNVDEILKELSKRLKIQNESGDKSKNEDITGDNVKKETKNKAKESNESSKDSGKPNSSDPSKPKRNSKSQNSNQNLNKDVDRKGDKTFKKNNQYEGKQKGSGRPYNQSNDIPPLFNQNQFPRHERHIGPQHPSNFSNSFQQPHPGFNGPHPPGYNNGPYPPPPSGFNGPYPHNPPGYAGPFQSPPSGFNGPYQPPPSGLNGPFQHFPPGYNGPNHPPFPHNGPPFGPNPSPFPPNQMHLPPQSPFGPPPYPGDNNPKNNDAGSINIKSNMKEFTHNALKNHDMDEYSLDGKGNKCDESYKKGKNKDTAKKNKGPEEARGNQNIKGDLFIAKNLWSKLDDMKKKTVEGIQPSELDDLIKEMEQSKIVDKKAFYNELSKVFGGMDNNSNSDSDSNGNDDSSRPNNSRRNGNYYRGRGGRGGRGRGRGNNNQRNFKQYNTGDDDDSDQHSVTSERSNCSRKGGRPYKNRGKTVKSDAGNADNKSENDEDSDQRSVKSEGGRRGRRPFKTGCRGSNKPRNNFNQQRENNDTELTGNVQEKNAQVDSGKYAPAEIMNKFMGRNIPTLLDAMKQQIDVTLKVKDVIVLGPNDDETAKEIPSTLLDIIFFKKKYPLAVCIPKDL